ncbi:unnamed protein product [Vitrella brassicaformis CCMP3155]|uniref:N-acetyltransferase domain-containing protein n=2 Tax=Vitrella brassicaformis TaxID=1169539 RepID=A0A0G4H2G9_VITBC|nr:unnamed protein product [Vitrella brassicaformis CCMP3155]|eukprot:CEM37833.1 unnamed protein product [Vitrella brassicaformis CCMP3155]
MAYVFPKKERCKDDIKILPLTGVLKDGATTVEVDWFSDGNFSDVHRMFNDALDDGDSYPYEGPMDAETFEAYYLSHDVFVCRITSSDSLAGTVVGSFYIKPNWPGRCSHICNGGFLVDRPYRGRGIGRFMAECFLKLAPALGYRASFFNLVFASNEASIRLWDSLGFERVGVVPRAGRLKGLGYVDAIQYMYDFGPWDVPADEGE